MKIREFITLQLLKRIFIKFLHVDAVLFVALVLGFLLIDRDVYNEFLSSEISAVANQNGIPLTLTKPEFFLTGLRAENADCSLPAGKTFILLQPKNLELKTSLKTIFGKDVSAQLNSKLYDGDITGELHQSSEDNYEAKVNIVGLDISKHPQIAPFGIKSGKIDLELNDFHFSKDRPLDGELKISLKDFSIPNELSLEKYAIPITVPAITDCSLDSEMSLKTMEEGQLNLIIKSLNLKSSLLELELDGDLKFFNDSLNNNLRITGNVTLSDELRKLVNPQLVLAAVQASGHRVISNLTKDSSSFTVNVAGLVKKLRIECEDKESPTVAEDSITARKIKRAKLKR